MKTMTHTPGPWSVSCAANAAFTRHPSILSDAGEVAKATWAGSEQQTDANARLISAAPELLAAVKALDDVFSHYCDGDPSPEEWAALKAARAAVQKAAEGAL